MRFFRRPIQPAEIGRKLERAMEDSRVVSVGGPLVANDYRVDLHPQDMTAFASFVGPLSAQLASWLAEQIADRGYQTLAPVAVTLLGNSTVPRRAIRVDAQTMSATVETALPEGMRGTTAVYEGPPPAAPPPPPAAPLPPTVPPHGLRLLNGPGKDRVFVLRGAITTVGRGTDNDLVLESNDVSRHHLRIECAGGQWRLHDLNSTNGTKVNGQPVREAPLRPGDRIDLGTLALEFVPQPVGAGV